MRRESPAALRNREPIRAELGRWMSGVRRVLEVPCGTGVHSAHLSMAFPHATWIPADIDPLALASTAAWRSEGSAGLQAPRHLDVTDVDWLLEPVDLVLAINLIHAAPPEVMPGLVNGASQHLLPGGRLVLYGPFREGGQLGPSNVRFEREYLQQKDPRWGIHALEAVTEVAQEAGLFRTERVSMPANNLLVVFRKPEVSTPARVG